MHNDYMKKQEGRWGGGGRYKGYLLGNLVPSFKAAPRLAEQKQTEN